MIMDIQTKEQAELFKTKLALIFAGTGLLIGLNSKDRTFFYILGYTIFLYSAGNIIGQLITYNKMKTIVESEAKVKTL